MVDAWIAGDCWLKPGVAPIDLRFISAGLSPSLLVVNLECAVPSGNPRSDRRSLLPLDPCRLRELAVANRTVCIMANNHVTDFGPESVLATLRAVTEGGLLALGAGATLEEARKPVVLDIAGRHIGLLAYADTRPHVGTMAASDRDPGVAPLDSKIVLEDVRRLARSVNDLWLFLHWGREHLRYPEPEQRLLARQFVDAGATLIVGIHPHVLQGCERLAKTPVHYSLGNFIFPPIELADGPLFRWDMESRQGILLKGILAGDAWQWAHIPYDIDADGNPQRPSPKAQRAITARMELLSKAFDSNYTRRYPALRRREQVMARIRRLKMMTWGERVRLPGRLIRDWSRRVRSGGKPEEG